MSHVSMVMLLVCMNTMKVVKIRLKVHIAQFLGLLVATYNDAQDTPKTPCKGKKCVQRSANHDLNHLGALLPSTALQ